MPPLLSAALVVLFEGLSFGAILPIIGYFNEELGGKEWMVGLMLALVSGPKVLTNPLFGQLSDRIGRRPVLIVNTLGTLAGSVTWALAGSVHGLVLSRVVTGVFSAQAGLAQAVAADTTSGEKRAGAMGLLGAAFGIAFALGPIAGGQLAKHTSYASVGWLCASFQVLSLLNILFLLPETRRRVPRPDGADPAGHPAAPRPATGGVHRLFGLLNQGAIVRLIVVTVLMTFAISQMISTLGLITKDTYGFTAAQAGYAFGAIGVIGIIIQGGVIRVLVRRFAERAVTLGGLACLAIGFTGVAHQGMSNRPAIAEFWSAVALIGVGSALVVPCVTALLSRAAAEQDQGSVNGLNQSATGLGRAGGNFVGAWVYDAIGHFAPYVSAAALCVVALVILVPRPGPVGPRPAG